MNVTKLRKSIGIDASVAIVAVDATDNANVKSKSVNQDQSDIPGQEPDTREELTPENVSLYLGPILATSCYSIDALIGDLGLLREKLVVDGGLIEQGIAEFASLNQSVMRLTEIVTEEVTHIDVPSVAV